MILGVVVLTVVTHIMSDGRVVTQETAQSGMEECHRIAEIVNHANGAGKYKFFASCAEGKQNYLARSQDRSFQSAKADIADPTSGSLAKSDEAARP